jgi:hypothetical protein
MIRLSLKDKVTLHGWIDRLVNDVPDTTWAVVRRGPAAGFDLILFNPSAADGLIPAITEQAAQCADAEADALTAALGLDVARDALGERA